MLVIRVNYKGFFVDFWTSIIRILESDTSRPSQRMKPLVLPCDATNANKRCKFSTREETFNMQDSDRLEPVE